MLIVQTHVAELLKFPDILKDKKADSLRKLNWHIQTHISALGALDQPVDTWDTLIIHLAKEKLDYPEQRDWQDRIKNYTPKKMPTLEEFTKFLAERSRALLMLQQGKPKTANSKQSAINNKKAEKKMVMGLTIENQRNTTNKANPQFNTYPTPTCSLCKGTHPVYQCDELLKRQPEEREKFLLDKKHCINCLRFGHLAKDCRGKGCRKCNARHNTLLHKEQLESRTEVEKPSTSSQIHCSQHRNTNDFTEPNQKTL